MKNLALRIICLALLALAMYTDAIAQASSEYKPKMLVYENLKNSDVLRGFEKRFTELDELLKDRIMVQAPFARFKALVGEGTEIDSLFAAKTAHEIVAMRSHNGLEITGQVYGRLDGQLHIDEDDDMSVYKAKTQAEIGWNIINSRFYQGKNKYRKISLANELDRLQMQKRKLSGIYEVAEDSLIQEYNFYIGVLMTHRLKNLDLLNEAYQYMLEQDRISSDEMLDVMHDKMDAEYQLSMISSGKDLGECPLYTIKATRLYIDTVALWKHLDEGGVDAQISKTRESMIDNEKALTNYLSTTRLTPFFRWSTYWTSTNKISNNADLGVRFTIPLWNESGRKKKALDTEKEIIRSDKSDVVKRVRSECELQIKKINQLNRAISTEHFHIQQLGKYIEIRRNAYLSQNKGYNYLLRMEECNEYLQSMERLCRLMLTRTQALIAIQKSAALLSSKVIASEMEI